MHKPKSAHWHTYSTGQGSGGIVRIQYPGCLQSGSDSIQAVRECSDRVSRLSAEWFGQYAGFRRMVRTVSGRPQNGSDSIWASAEWFEQNRSFQYNKRNGLKRKGTVKEMAWSVKKWFALWFIYIYLQYNIFFVVTGLPSFGVTDIYWLPFFSGLLTSGPGLLSISFVWLEGCVSTPYLDWMPVGWASLSGCCSRANRKSKRRMRIRKASRNSPKTMLIPRVKAFQVAFGSEKNWIPLFLCFLPKKIRQHHLSGTAVQNLSLLAVVEGKVWTCQWCIMVKPLDGNPVPAKTIMATKLAARKIIKCFCALHWKISLNVQCMFELSISVFQSCQHIAAPKMNRMVGQLVTAKYYHILPASFHQSFHQHESLTYAGSQQPVEWIYSSAQSCKGKGQPYDRSWPFST